MSSHDRVISAWNSLSGEFGNYSFCQMNMQWDNFTIPVFINVFLNTFKNEAHRNKRNHSNSLRCKWVARYSAIWRRTAKCSAKNPSFSLLLKLTIKSHTCANQRLQKTTQDDICSLCTVYFHLIRLCLSRTLSEKKNKMLLINLWSRCRLQATDNRLEV